MGHKLPKVPTCDISAEFLGPKIGGGGGGKRGRSCRSRFKSKRKEKEHEK